MKLTCAQMDVLISFYIDGDLSESLKNQVEEHIKTCKTCRAKYDVVKSMVADLKNKFGIDDTPSMECWKWDSGNSATTEQYRIFKNNLSAYIDNELPDEESIKVKKFTINNKRARQDLQDNYNIRKLMGDSFRKSKDDFNRDFSRSVMKRLELDDEVDLGFHPAIKLLIAFTVSVLILTTMVLLWLN